MFLRSTTERKLGRHVTQKIQRNGYNSDTSMIGTSIKTILGFDDFVYTPACMLDAMFMGLSRGACPRKSSKIDGD